MVTISVSFSKCRGFPSEKTSTPTVKFLGFSSAPPDNYLTMSCWLPPATFFPSILVRLCLRPNLRRTSRPSAYLSCTRVGGTRQIVERKSKGQAEVIGEKDKLQCHFLNRNPHQENWDRTRAYEWLGTNCPVQQRIAAGSEDDDSRMF